MTTNKSESMALSHIHTTTDYGLFKSIEGNRNLNLQHLNRLRNSMQERPLFTIITVNEKHEIIDGQHRFEASKELRLPINYVICPGYGLNDVHILNAASNTWYSDDYLEGYCRLQNPHYLQYRQFREQYGFPHEACMIILGNGLSHDYIKDFYNGKFKVNSIKTAIEFAEKMELIGNYYDGYKRKSFIFAMYGLMKKDQFEFMEFMNKLRLCPSMLTDCTNVSQYITLIEEIYNYRRREKVNLRY